MNIIQTFWSCNKTRLLYSNSGWLSPEYNIMSWALSCLQLKNYYPNVVLYCDSISAKLLIDTLKLSYSNVVCELDQLPCYHEQLWAMPKIYSYSLQKEPFLHIDGDIYIWSAFDNKLLTGELIAQNMEAATNYYESKMKTLESNFKYFPEAILKERKKRPMYAYNAGLIGGSDINFFQTYTTEAFKFIERNQTYFSRINVSDFNIFFEQYLFYCQAKYQNKKVSVLMNDLIKDNGYKGFGDFAEVPHNKQYLHLIGTYKKDIGVCKQLANRLRQDYPEHYYRIISLYKKRQIPLFKDYYYFVKETSEEDLLYRYKDLKAYKDEKTFFDNNLNKEVFASKVSFQKKMILEKLLELDLSKKQHADAIEFADSLNRILDREFINISRDGLYKRDIDCTQYFQYIFSDKEKVYEKTLIKNANTEIIQSLFDWSSIMTGNVHPTICNNEAIEGLSRTYTVVIPECDKTGFSLYNIDELDILMLEVLKKPVTIKQLFNVLKSSFDDEDLDNSIQEFEQLIFMRIKKGLENKAFRCIINNN